MRVEINRNVKTAVYKQIVEQIREQILLGELPEGYCLPPERRLADSIGVNRTTVLNAYRELKAENLIASHIGRGTIVLPVKQEDNPQNQVFTQEPIWEYFFSQNTIHFQDSQLNSMLDYINRKDNISFASGMAYPNNQTEKMLKEILHRIIEAPNFDILFGTMAEGYPSLRQAMSKFMERRECFCNPDEIMILSGSQQGIDLTARVLLEPGDVIIVEDPTYMPALQAFRSIGARIIGVPIDSNGMNTEILEQVVQRYQPKLIYTVPTYQNPTGVNMTLERRKHLIELANRYKVLVLEDDAYGELCYEGNPLPTLKSMDKSGYVIYLSSFSKILYPGLRIGWVVAQKKLIKRFASARKATDLHTNSLSQKIIEYFITETYYKEQLKRICKEYQIKRDRMIHALEQFAPPGMTWTVPTGGYYIWCKLPERVSATRLLALSSEQKVSFIPGSLFFSSPQEQEYVRFNFTYTTENQIDKGIKILCRLITEEQKQGRKIKSEAEIYPLI